MFNDPLPAFVKEKELDPSVNAFDWMPTLLLVVIVVSPLNVTPPVKIIFPELVESPNSTDPDKNNDWDKVLSSVFLLDNCPPVIVIAADPTAPLWPNSKVPPEIVAPPSIVLLPCISNVPACTNIGLGMLLSDPWNICSPAPVLINSASVSPDPWPVTVAPDVNVDPLATFIVKVLLSKFNSGVLERYSPSLIPPIVSSPLNKFI